jgi:hypothetical protein
VLYALCLGWRALAKLTHLHTLLPLLLPVHAAVERGRELRNDYKLIARALTRKANALVKQGKLEEAVGIYQKSLTEHRWAGQSNRGV